MVTEIGGSVAENKTQVLFFLASCSFIFKILENEIYNNNKFLQLVSLTN